MTNQAAIDTCREIGGDLFDRGADIGGTAWHRKLNAYAYWRDAVEALGIEAARAEVVTGYTAAVADEQETAARLDRELGELCHAAAVVGHRDEKLYLLRSRAGSYWWQPAEYAESKSEMFRRADEAAADLARTYQSGPIAWVDQLGRNVRLHDIESYATACAYDGGRERARLGDLPRDAATLWPTDRDGVGTWHPEWSIDEAAARVAWEQGLADGTAAAVLSEPPAQVIARCCRGLRQIDVSEVLGVSQSAVSQWLAGDTAMTRPVRLLALAQAGVLPAPGGQWRLWAAR